MAPIRLRNYKTALFRRRHRDVHMMSVKRLHSDERGGILVLSAFMVAVFLVLDGARRRRRQLVHAQAPASEQGGRRRPRSGIRVPRDSSRTARASPVATATAISEVAKRYAGTGDAARSGQQVQPDHQRDQQSDRPNQCVQPDGCRLDGWGEPVHGASDRGFVQPRQGALDRRQGAGDKRRDALRRIRPQPAVGDRAGAGRVEADRWRAQGRAPLHQRDGRLHRLRLGGVRSARAPGTRVSLIGILQSRAADRGSSTPRRWTANVGGIDIDAATRT